ncbi:hypothetical protein RHP75_08120 [Pseudomonas sp. SG20056]|uniref:hypothetical protein n=1 Tax=Pseudomonas sp. SG20056 TaxID=3074146 RepID=UPI00287F5553|nr:hypothetical protein [Pseudomonas sp. SG20056]WNF48366.1 hypothetical protein RHP75_08120 [Pseudomonas sp. SG20056]
MRVEITHHIDSSEQDADGFYDWYYEYYLYSFVDGDTELVARSYTTDQDKAQIISIKRNGIRASLTSKDMQLSIVSEAVQHLRSAGKIEISWLSEAGYIPL